MPQTILIGTRGSALALAQAEGVARQLRDLGARVELRIIKTTGDRVQGPPEMPAEKGVFVKEIEAALLAGEVRLAVHSLKDLPTDLKPGLLIAAVPLRADPRDALISRGQRLADLPRGARVGTSSPRRRAQLLRVRPDLEMLPVRGNVDTRLRKLAAGDYDAIVLAAAGLERLGLGGRIVERLACEVCLPAPGQGALAVEARAGDEEAIGIARRIEDAASRACVEAERALLAGLGGGCRVPIGALAEAEGAALRLRGVVASPDGARAVFGEKVGERERPQELGRLLAEDLAAQLDDAAIEIG
jgi:hydroxymethylbilane synthase